MARFHSQISFEFSKMGSQYMLLFEIIITVLHVSSTPEIASSHIEVFPIGTLFQPASNVELLRQLTIGSFVDCAAACNVNPQCRTLMYDWSTGLCSLYEGETSTGSIITNSSSSSSQVGSIDYFSELYQCYNKTSSTCAFNRYVVEDPSTGLGVCPENTYWDGNMCLNQLYFGAPCTSQQSCRTDLFLGCSNVTAWTCGAGKTRSVPSRQQCF